MRVMKAIDPSTIGTSEAALLQPDQSPIVNEANQLNRNEAAFESSSNDIDEDMSDVVERTKVSLRINNVSPQRTETLSHRDTETNGSHLDRPIKLEDAPQKEQSTPTGTATGADIRHVNESDVKTEPTPVQQADEPESSFYRPGEMGREDFTLFSTPAWSMSGGSPGPVDAPWTPRSEQSTPWPGVARLNRRGSQAASGSSTIKLETPSDREGSEEHNGTNSFAHRQMPLQADDQEQAYEPPAQEQVDGLGRLQQRQQRQQRHRQRLHHRHDDLQQQLQQTAQQQQQRAQELMMQHQQRIQQHRQRIQQQQQQQQQKAQALKMQHQQRIQEHQQRIQEHRQQFQERLQQYQHDLQEQMQRWQQQAGQLHAAQFAHMQHHTEHELAHQQQMAPMPPMPHMPQMPQMPQMPPVPPIPQMLPMPSMPQVPQMRQMRQMPPMPQMPQMRQMRQMPPMPQMSHIPSILSIPQIPSLPSLPPLPSMPTMPRVVI